MNVGIHRYGFSGPAMGVASAVLFGASTPLAKVLLGGDLDPWLLAALLYAGSGAGLALVHVSRRVLDLGTPEAPLSRADLPWLAGVVLCGGIAGPLLLMVGLVTTEASATSLLLNVEGLATMPSTGSCSGKTSTAGCSSVQD